MLPFVVVARRGGYVRWLIVIGREVILLRFYDFHESGNGYKVRLLLSLLAIRHERIEMNILAGDTRTPEYLSLNPNGRVPLLEFEDGRTLSESNAILFFLAEGSQYFPDDLFLRAQVLQWMFFEQYSHEPYIAVIRFWTFAGELEAHEAEIPERRRRGDAALDLMEAHLAQSDFFVGEQFSVADIALYAYTHVAHEGGFDLSSRPSINRWLARVTGQPRMIAIDDAAKA